MALTVNTNIASLTAQRNLTASQGDLSTSLQRLSSGLRINSAKDDAAGLAISERFTSQIRGLNQGARNANDGISLAQTAEGALKEVTSNLQRIRELAVQSANATNSASDRAALKAEADQLIAEIDRVASGTKFNGINLLDGTFTSQAFQVGADSGETVSITSIGSARTSSLGQSTTATSGAQAATAQESTGSNLTINGVLINASTDDGSGATDADSSAKAIAAAINGTSGTGVTASASAATAAGVTASTAGSGSLDTLVINGVDVVGGTSAQAAIADNTTGTDGTNSAAIALAINNNSAATGVTATVNSTTKAVDLSATDGRNFTATFTFGAGSDAADFGLNAGFTTTTAVTTRGNVTLSSESSIVVVDAGTVIGGSATYNSSNTGTAVSALDLSTVSGAETALTSIDSALSTISSTRSDLGSYQARFESVVANVQTTAENLSASRSRIMDADFASETANLTKAQILQQSGIAMLAQANSIPQNVLALLQ